MNGVHRPITVFLALVVLGLIAFGLIAVASRTVGLFGSLDTRLTAILLTAMSVATILALGLRAAAAVGERKLRWERRLRCYEQLLATASGAATEKVLAAADLALLASPGAVRTINRFQRLMPTDPARPAALAALVRELRRDLGQDSATLSEAELLAPLPRTGRSEEATL